MQNQLVEMPINIGALRTQGLLNYEHNRLTSVGSVHLGPHASLTELNWFTDLAAKAKAAAAAEAAKVKAFNAAAIAKVKADAAAEAAKVKAFNAAALQKVKQDAVAAAHKLAAFNAAALQKAKDDIANAKAAAIRLAAMSKEEAGVIIHAATEMAKAEGVKLANQLITDAEGEGHVLNGDAKAKILALSIEIGQQASDKVQGVDNKLDAFLDAKKDIPFIGSLVAKVEAGGHVLTLKGQEEVVALAAILGKKGEDKADAVDSKIDDILNKHRPELDRPELDGPELDRPELDGPELDRPELDRPITVMLI